MSVCQRLVAAQDKGTLAVAAACFCVLTIFSPLQPSACFAAEPSGDAASRKAVKRNFTWTGPLADQNRKIEIALRQQVDEMFENFSPSAKRGYRNLVGKKYLPPDFDEEILANIDSFSSPHKFNDIDTEPSVTTYGSDRSSWIRYGIAHRPDDHEEPLQYVHTDQGQFVMNCFACHGGSLYGATYPGSPNTLYGLEMLTEDVRRTKLDLKKTLTHMDIGSMFMPLGKSVGHSNAVMFGVALMNYRDADLNIHALRPPARMVHHDMDAPPWWHFKKKTHIYIDGFAEKGHRGLMQFMLVKENGPKQFRSWENDFRDVYQFLSELQAPKYPLPVNNELVVAGEMLFKENCSRCHGTYGTDSSYPERLIRIDEIGTDRVRLDALTPTHRSNYAKSWFADNGEQQTFVDPGGYIAPPLDGVWATAPYFHNGSVPTVWGVLRPDERPAVWSRNQLGIDTSKIGFAVDRLDRLPAGLSKRERRFYFDTTTSGNSAAGHDFAEHLSDEECRALVEYLKTI